MSDFAQAGRICTLQRLNDTHLAGIEDRLASAAAARPITLILPCHARDLLQPALARILEELKDTSWLREIIVPVNGLSNAEAGVWPLAIPELGLPVRVVRTDAGGTRDALTALAGPLAGRGKGFNVWAATGIICAEAKSQIIIAQDCDVTSFSRSTLARLALACADSGFGFDFARMYYSRVADRLYGRVSRLFLPPLLDAILAVMGHHPLLGFLTSFRYPLAGETACTTALAATLPGHPGWGLEIAQLCDVFRVLDPSAVCQVDGGTGYDHRHQPALPALSQMCREIAGTLFAHLAVEGCVIDRPARAALVGAFRDQGAAALRRFAALASMNDLPFDLDEERALLTEFTRSLEDIPDAAAPVLPCWADLLRDRPSNVAAYLDAVDPSR